MADGFLVDDVLGWRLTDDRRHALIGIRNAEGLTVDLAIDANNLFKILTAICAATEAFAPDKSLGPKEIQLLDPEWSEAGRIGDSSDGYFAFCLRGGGLLGFRLPDQQMRSVLQALSVQYPGLDGTAPSPETSVN